MRDWAPALTLLLLLGLVPAAVSAQTGSDGSAPQAASPGSIVIDGVPVALLTDIPGRKGCPGANEFVPTKLRFVDCENGTVLDTLQDLLFLKDASCDALGPNGDGTGSYDEAVASVSALAAPFCGLTDGSTAGDWSLASILEFYPALSDGVRLACASPVLVDDTGVACWTGPTSSIAGLDTVGDYWLSDTLDVDNGSFCQMTDGDCYYGPKSVDRYIWPVRPAR